MIFVRKELPSLDEDVIGNFKQDKIDGIAFMELDGDYLWELHPVLGDHMKIKKLVRTSVEFTSFPSIPRSCTLNSSSMS